MQEITAPSGAAVTINPAPFVDAIALHNVLLNEASRGTGHNIPTAFMVFSSERVQAALFKCLARCLYKGEKITPETFNPDDRRQDLYPVATACVKENIGPFLPGLISLLEEMGVAANQAETTGKSPKRKSATTQG